MKKFALLVLGSAVVPAMTFASDTTFGDILATLIGYLNYVVPAFITVAVAYFIWGVIQFITSSEEDAKKKGKGKIINGLIGLFVIISFWGIIAVLQNTFRIDNRTNSGIAPCVPTTANDMGRDC